MFAYRTAPNQFAVLFMDITKRKQAEEQRQRLALELADRVAELQGVLDAVPVAAPPPPPPPPPPPTRGTPIIRSASEIPAMAMPIRS